MDNHGIVIIGGGMAGYTLAREIRKLDAAVPLTLVTADDGRVYSKPMLSTALAQGKSAEALVQKTASEFAAGNGVTVRANTRVTAIAPGAHTVALRSDAGDQELAYRDLVLATGAEPRPYRFPDGTLVPAVNSLDDYARWRHALRPDARVLIVGAGLIGVEFANDLARAGHPVDIIDPLPHPLGRLLPADLGRVMADALAAAGVTLHLGRTVAEVRRDGDRPVAELDDGTEVAFDLPLAAIGLVPRTALAQHAGLDVDAGIKVDGALRTSRDNIYALGDGAETGAGILPFVLPLMAEARALAKTLTGAPARLHLPALPVVVKTPALATVVCPPRPGAPGEWWVEGKGKDRRAIFFGSDDTPLGFVLTGTRVAERHALAKTMPDLLTA